jgi:hypothetical protein
VIQQLVLISLATLSSYTTSQKSTKQRTYSLPSQLSLPGKQKILTKITKLKKLHSISGILKKVPSYAQESSNHPLNVRHWVDNCFNFRWDIKWVDDTHALGVFSSPEVAAEALALRFEFLTSFCSLFDIFFSILILCLYRHPRILSRPLNMATPQSKSKARAVCEQLLPYKPRPASCTAPARRLLQWALGKDYTCVRTVYRYLSE